MLRLVYLTSTGLSCFWVDRVVVSWDHDGVNGVENTVGAINIGWELRIHHGVIEEVLTESASDSDGCTVDGSNLTRSDGARGNLSGDNVVLKDLGQGGWVGKQCAHVLWEGRVDWCEDGEWTGSLEGVGESGGLNGLDEVTEAIVTTDLGFTESHRDSISSPSDGGTLGGSSLGQDVSSKHSLAAGEG